MNFVRFPGNQKKNMPTHMAGSESEHIPIEGWSNGLVRVLVLHLRKWTNVPCKKDHLKKERLVFQP